MLALRSILVIAGADEAAYAAAATTAADAVLFDLAAPHVAREREAARRLVAQQAPAVARARRGVIVRLGDTRSQELEADVEAVVGSAIGATILSGAEQPQDVRDADVALRKREMRRGIAPGTIRLIPEIDSALGLRSLPAMLEAVDRHGAVALDAGALLARLRIPRTGAPPATGARAALEEHAMADVALAAGATALATRAHDLGAAGVTVASDAEARGMNALFAPDPAERAIARATVEEWERLRGRGRWLGAVGKGSEARSVDRRNVRLARAFLAQAEAIDRREAAR